MILLVDDTRGMLALTQMALAGLDVQVGYASGIAEALSLSRRVVPSLILLDLNLDGEDGMSLLPHLRADPKLQAVPVLGFSVHDSRKVEGASAGLRGFVKKPFHPDELREAVLPFVGASSS